MFKEVMINGSLYDVITPSASPSNTPSWYSKYLNSFEKVVSMEGTRYLVEGKPRYLDEIVLVRGESGQIISLTHESFNRLKPVPYKRKHIEIQDTFIPYKSIVSFSYSTYNSVLKVELPTGTKHWVVEPDVFYKLRTTFLNFISEEEI